MSDTSNESLGLLIGAEPISRFLDIPYSRKNKSNRIYYLLQCGHIDADKIGDLWVTTEERLRRQFDGHNRYTPPAKQAAAVAAPAPVAPKAKPAVKGKRSRARISA